MGFRAEALQHPDKPAIIMVESDEPVLVSQREPAMIGAAGRNLLQQNRRAHSRMIADFAEHSARKLQHNVQ